MKKKIFKKPVIKNTEQVTSKVDNNYTLTLDMPIEYTEPVIFHDEYEDFQIADLGDLVMELWERSEDSHNIPGFDIKEILKMEEIEI